MRDAALGPPTAEVAGAAAPLHRAAFALATGEIGSLAPAVAETFPLSGPQPLPFALTQPSALTFLLARLPLSLLGSFLSTASGLLTRTLTLLAGAALRAWLAAFCPLRALGSLATLAALAWFAAGWTSQAGRFLELSAQLLELGQITFQTLVAALSFPGRQAFGFADLLLQLFQSPGDALFTLCDMDGITLTNIRSSLSQPTADCRLL